MKRDEVFLLPVEEFGVHVGAGVVSDCKGTEAQMELETRSKGKWEGA